MSQLMQAGVVSESSASPLPTERNRCFESGRLQERSEVAAIENNGSPEQVFFIGSVSRRNCRSNLAWNPIPASDKPHFIHFPVTNFLQDSISRTV